MKISLNWLKELININVPIEELKEVLTNIGLEVAATETFYPVKGGLKGLVIGKVIEVKKHENSDHLSVTKVDVGDENLLNIVCGAPNVAKGQKVVVAMIGTKLYDGEKSFEIKKSKIRGVVSEGMICAEDEIGLGKSHEGILVLNEKATIGQSAADYFNLRPDTVIEIDLTPNRIDAASHYGVARDVNAYYNQYDKDCRLKKRFIDFKVDNTNLPIEIEIENKEACKRYSGVTLDNVIVKESPNWLKNYLKAIGLNPINNVVDVTNFVLHETGQPLHAFDAEKIIGQKVVVKTLPKGTKFITLDGKERDLNENDLMICNAIEPMCIGGVLGGLDSGVTQTTTSIFLESACFNPVYIRKTAKRHVISTDASYRFERGTDPNNTIYPLQLAAVMIKELAGGFISMKIQDIYPEKINNKLVEIEYSRVNSLIGENLTRVDIKNILVGLEIEIVAEKDKGLLLSVPTYRVDVTRESDIIEEILRLYGYNQVPIANQVKSILSFYEHPDKEQIINTVSNVLVANGFVEIMNNSLTAKAYYEGNKSFLQTDLVSIKNPLSNELNVMRQTLLFGLLETIKLNMNHQQKDIRIFEFGNCYSFKDKAFKEKQHLAVSVTGQIGDNFWDIPSKTYDYFTLKSAVELVLNRVGISEYSANNIRSKDIFEYGLNYFVNQKTIVEFGSIQKNVLNIFDIDKNVYYAEFNWTYIFQLLKGKAIQFKPLRKFPEVQRDLALLIDKNISFAEIHQVIEDSDKHLIRQVLLFDIFEDEKKLGKNKKSYAIRLILQDENKTLTEKEINKLINKVIRNLQEKTLAEIR